MQRRISKATDRSRDTFELYVRDLEDAVPLSAEDETAYAARIQDRRADLWASLLSYPPLAAPLAQLLVERFSEDEEVVQACAPLATAAQSARHTRTTQGGKAFRGAAQRLIEHVLEADQDDMVASLAAGDVMALVQGRGADLAIVVKRLPSLGKPFLAYVDRVRVAQDELRGAKMSFARANLRLVVHMARRFERSAVPLTDLIQEGNLGLMRAVDRFDHTRGFRFSTYATWWIRHSLNRAVLNTGRLVRVPVHVVERQRQIVSTRAQLTDDLGRAPSDAEIAKELGLPEHKVIRNEAAIAARAKSIDAPVAIGFDGSTTLADSLADDADPVDERIAWTQLGEQLEEAFTELDAVELDIIQRRFGLDGRKPETLREVGGSYGLSRERIRQLQARALVKMRGALAH